jgi:hypothetical protein
MKVKFFEQFVHRETLRLSCAALARIEIDGKLLFILNKNSVNVGKPTFGPLGGALEFSEAARPFLENLQSIFEKGNDLRITIPSENVQTYLDWFYTRENRESSSLREVFEELVLEEKIVKMQPEELDEIYVKTVEEDKISNRKGQEGVKTKAVYEIFTVTLPEHVQKQILEHLTNASNPKLVLVSPSEVLNDSRLGSHCKHVL